MKNPYLEEYLKSKGEDLKARKAREELVFKYSWAIPDEQSIDLIKKYSPLVEMGAGGGYWASLIRQKGGDILCFDKYVKNNYFSKQNWTEVSKGSPKDLINYPDRALFLCWPPYDNLMAYNCLKHFSGKYLIYIGENEGGCNGCDRFFNKLKNNYKLVEKYQNPRWNLLKDLIYVYERL